MSEEPRKTAGAEAVKLLQEADGKQSVVETEKEANKGYLEQIWECVQSEPAKDWDKPFYVVVVTKKEKLLQNIIRRYFLARKTMPMPDYDQSVFLYYPKTEQLRYLWTLPDPEACHEFYHIGADVDPQELELQGFVIEFLDDKLYDRCAQIYEINNEWAAEDFGHATKQQVIIE